MRTKWLTCVAVLAISGALAHGAAPSFQGLGDLTGGVFYSKAWGISADGSVVVGQSNSISGSETFRWDADNGMVGLGDLSDGAFYGFAGAASSDGAVVVGKSHSGSGNEAFRWTQSTGMVGMGDMPGDDFGSRAFAVSADGLVVVGRGTSNSGDEAFRWTAAGMVGLGDLDGGDFYSKAWDVSGNGAVVVGHSTTASGDEAFIWDADNGMRNLRDVLVNDCGLDLTDWTLRQARGVSDDGLTIAGYGDNLNGNTEAWVATIPEPATLSLLGIGFVALLRRRGQKGRR